MKTKLSKITLNFVPPIPWNIRRVMKTMINDITEITPIKHHLNVYVQAISYFDSSIGKATGLFGVYSKSIAGKYDLLPHGPKILIACKKFPHENKYSLFFRLWETFTHEIAHYEQYRDGRKIQERGIKVRARSLQKKMAFISDKNKDLLDFGN